MTGNNSPLERLLDWCAVEADIDAVRRALTAPPTVPEAVEESLKFLEDVGYRVSPRLVKHHHSIIRQAIAQHSEPGRGECGWSLDDEGCYHTDCGKEFEMVDFLTLEETSMKYCSNCGRRIRDDGRVSDARD